MLMQMRRGGGVVKVLSPEDMWDPEVAELMVVPLQGDSRRDELISKRELCFLSGERLPTCWMDSHYIENEWSAYKFGRHSRSTDPKMNQSSN